MIKVIHELSKSDLFCGFSADEIDIFLNEYGYFERKYIKGEEIYGPGDAIKYTGIILSGQVNVVQITNVGREGIVVSESPGELIGQAFSITGQHNSFAYFIAAADTDILYLDLRSVLSSPKNDSYYIKFINNITRILAGTNIQLNKKIQLLTQKTLREKLMTYFIQSAASSNSRSFKMNFNREQLASYVCAERSSVCRELGRMQDDGMIIMNGNNVTLCHLPEL
ncbi:cAMP-binding domain of CRP or a regulatory subunit of cAMP-dependent protein kinases [Lachnospiraceae bacterium XPB1003]|nr:cAMP-binding domain of CRP or a regulatory subunit of cAMP-dependent protein kinases [Lachnospiraceae bacterium XPB1003]